MRTVVIYPGRFYPFHRGHKASYDYLTRQYGQGNVYIATSNVQAPITSPFTYSDKVAMMTKLGIPSSNIVQVASPYQAKEITSEIDDKDNTVLIFAVSEKDMSGDGARFKFGVKKNGEPSYMQPLPAKAKDIKPMSQHAYVTVTPTVNFRVRGVDANSASEIRKLYMAGSDADRDNIITDLYGSPDPELRDIFDQRLAVTAKTQQAIKEARASKQYTAKAVKLLETVQRLEQLAHCYEAEDLAEAYIWPSNPEAVAKTKQAMARPVSTSTDKVKTFASQGYTIKFKPDVAEIYHGTNLVYSRAGNYANPTKQQLSSLRARVTDLVAKKKIAESADYLNEKRS